MDTRSESPELEGTLFLAHAVRGGGGDERRQVRFDFYTRLQTHPVDTEVLDDSTGETELDLSEDLLTAQLPRNSLRFCTASVDQRQSVVHGQEGEDVCLGFCVPGFVS